MLRHSTQIFARFVVQVTLSRVVNGAGCRTGAAHKRVRAAGASAEPTGRAEDESSSVGVVFPPPHSQIRAHVTAARGELAAGLNGSPFEPAVSSPLPGGGSAPRFPPLFK